MGHQNLAAAATTPVRSPDPYSPVPPASLSLSADGIKSVWDRAVTALRHGDHSKALRIFEDSAPEFQDSALFHRISGSISLRVAGLFEDPKVKHLHLSHAMESAKKAVTLSPNSVEYSQFYAELMFGAGENSSDFDKVAEECDRGLGIENPTDPIDEEAAEDYPAAEKEKRVAMVRGQIMTLKKRAQIASISTWMKDMDRTGGGDDRFKLVPVRKAVVDPEHLVADAGGKTVEERGKEARVGLGRQMQEEKGNDKGGEGGDLDTVSANSE